MLYRGGINLYHSEGDGLCQVLNSLFAVSTPGGEELHHPHVVTLQHHLVKVVISEHDHIILTAAASAAALLQEGSSVLLSHVR